METKGTINIDGMDIPIENEKNILEVIRKADIELPTFCYHSHLSTYGACRLCICDIEGMGIQATCTMAPKPGWWLGQILKKFGKSEKSTLSYYLPIMTSVVRAVRVQTIVSCKT
jgi:NADH-quinone oxidoreductase subunit G